MFAKLVRTIYVALRVLLTTYVLPYLRLFKVDFQTPENKRKHVILITGCDTGFGYLSAKKLDAQGFTGVLFSNTVKILPVTVLLATAV